MKWALAAVAVWGCYSPTVSPGAPCGPNSECPTGLVCSNGTCERTAAAVDAAGPDGPVVCGCSGANVVCGDVTTPCGVSCSSEGEPHCIDFAPVNDASFDVTTGTNAVSFNQAYDVDVDTGAIVERGTMTSLRAAGAGIVDGIYYAQLGAYAVFGVTGLSMNQNADVRFTGTRAVILLVDGDAEIRGIVDVSGGCASGTKECGGPGGGRGGVAGAGGAGGCGPGRPGTTVDGSTSPTHAFGGGGGGFGTAGEQGAGTADSGGAACASSTLVPLLGGSGGGRGGNVTSTGLDGGVGGGGGGAIQISATGSISITGAGVIDAGGAGGQRDPGTTRGAGGGGAGGGILLQATSVTVTGAVAANGGGGGGHNTAGDGEDGTRSTTPAKGFGTSALYKGGDGGAGTTAPTGVGTAHGGGGGGAVGFIRVLAATTDLTGTISPPATTGTP